MSATEQRRHRRIAAAIVVESAATRAALLDLQDTLDDRVAVTLQLLADASAEYERALHALERIRKCQSVAMCNRVAREFLESVGR